MQLDILTSRILLSYLFGVQRMNFELWGVKQMFECSSANPTASHRASDMHGVENTQKKLWLEP